MTSRGISIVPVEGIGEVGSGDDVAQLILDALEAQDTPLINGDVLVVTHKIVSKAEGRVAPVPSGEAGDRARRSIAEAEAVRVLRRRNGMIIAQTEHGFICANAGVDNSNVEEGLVVLLPKDPDLSARRIRSKVKAKRGVDVAVVISDTFGRPWRVGQTDVAIGVAGMLALIDYRGTEDHFGQLLKVTSIAIADEVASAGELVMGKADRIPVALIRGLRFHPGRGSARDLVRSPVHDMFR